GPPAWHSCVPSRRGPSVSLLLNPDRKNLADLLFCFPDTGEAGRDVAAVSRGVRLRFACPVLGQGPLAFKQVDELLRLVGDVIRAGHGFPEPGQKLAVIRLVLDPCLHGRVALEGLPAVKVRGDRLAFGGTVGAELY